MYEDTIFKIVTTVSLELTEILRKETNDLYIDLELLKPMLYYNVIVHGIPVFLKEFTTDLHLKMMPRGCVKIFIFR